MRDEVVDNSGNVQSISVDHERLDVGARKKLKDSTSDKYCEENEAEELRYFLHCAEERDLDVESEFGDVAVNEFVILTLGAQLACVLGGVP